MKNEQGIIGLFIDGNYFFTEQTVEHRNVYHQTLLGHLSQADATHLNLAVEAASNAQKQWAMLPAYRRSELLFALAEELQRNTEEAAMLIVAETAKPITLARAEIMRAVTTYRLSAEEATRLQGETLVMDAVRGGEGKSAFTVLEPVGVIAAITPFNFPFNLVAHKIGPALAAGNAVIIKPSSQTPCCALWIAEAAKRVGIQDGVINVIIGSGGIIGDALVTHKGIQMISFTGSFDVGLHIRSIAGLRKTLLELGSNSAVILDQSTDINLIAPKLASGACAFSGQVCISIQRIAVHESQHDQLCSLLKTIFSGWIVGTDPAESNTSMSKMINSSALIKAKNAVQQAKNAGATVICGDDYHEMSMWPTVLTDCPSHLDIVQQEMFAPIVVIQKYRDIQEAIDWVNDSRYGLNTGFYSNNLKHVWHAIRTIKSGALLINEIPTYRADHMPYGGVKDSGTGKEGVAYAVREMCHEKLIVIQP